MILLVLALVSFTCANTITDKEADIQSGFGTGGKQGGKLKAGDSLTQNDQSDGSYNMRFSDGQLAGITRFEKVPMVKHQADNEASSDFHDSSVKRLRPDAG